MSRPLPLTAFCIRRSDDPAPPEGLRTPAGESIRLLREGPLGVWYAPGAPPHADLEAISAHDAVIRAALRSATPLPVRFGISFPDEEALRASLRERRGVLLEALERVQGRVEMGLRVTWKIAPSLEKVEGAVHSGKEYLQARRKELQRREEEERRASALLDRVEALLAPEVHLSKRKVLPEPGVAGLLAHLVHRHEVQTYRSRVESAREQLEEAGLHLTGPWAPYSFV